MMVSGKISPHSTRKYGQYFRGDGKENLSIEFLMVKVRFLKFSARLSTTQTWTTLMLKKTNKISLKITN